MEFSRPNTGVGSFSLLQGIFPAKESNWGLLHCRQILYQLSYQGSPLSGLVMPNSFVTPWTVACRAPLSLRFPRQEYWRRLPFPSPGNLPNPGIELTSSAISCGFFTTESPGKPVNQLYSNMK